MRTRILTLILTTLLVALTGQAQTPLTSEEKTYAIDYLKETKDDLVKIIKGLSEEQLSFKPNDQTWSVEECAKHIAIAEQGIWSSFFENALQTTVDPSQRVSLQFSDDQIKGFLEDRSRRVQTSTQGQPVNFQGSIKDAMKQFKDLRGEHIKFVKKTNEDLRNRYATMPVGKIDAFQVIIFMSAHTRRHTKQIREVMELANFPGK